MQAYPPFFLSIPGNHDLKRPNPKSPTSAAFRNWWQDEIVRKSFWEDPKSRYRRAVKEAFRSYINWSMSNCFLKPPDFQSGLLPGEFSATLVKGDAKLGLVGLNSTFLQISGDDYKGKLDLDVRQLATACGDDAPAWLKQKHACFLLTHQPHTWLSRTALEQFRGGIYTPDNFSAHFYGHMHEQESFVISEGSDQARRHFQGVSLFGLDRFGEAFDKARLRFGYSAGRLEMDRERGHIYLWPRQAMMQQSGAWRLVPDQGCGLLAGCQHTPPIEVSLRIPCDGTSGSQLLATARPSSFTTGISSLSKNTSLERLTRLRNESVARCLTRWQAAGVSRGLAAELANDSNVGSPSPEMIPSSQKPIVLLVGPVGSGKSLIGERLHQSAIERAITNPNAPTPVYLEIPSVIGRLVDAVENAVISVGGYNSKGAAVFLHESIGGETADIRIDQRQLEFPPVLPHRKMLPRIAP